MRSTKTNFILMIMTLIITANAYGQKLDLAKIFNDKKFTIRGRTATALEDDKHKGIKLDEQTDEGLLWLTGAEFKQGTIEFDVRGKDVQGKSFVGIAFHGMNDSTYDAVYFRPFNFRTTDPVRKIHAVQYISHPTYTWKKLRDENNGVYEKAVNPVPDPNGWFHARIEVSGKTVKVFVDDATTPSLTVEKLNDRQSGAVGLWVGDGSGGDFANLKITSR
jgi:hypothetical protein